MTVKFRDPISAKACIIVSHPFHRYLHAFASHSLSRFSENARQVLRRPSSGSIPLYWPRTVQAFERRRRKHSRRWHRFGTQTSRRFCSVVDGRRRGLSSSFVVPYFGLYVHSWMKGIRIGPCMCTCYIKLSVIFGIQTK